VYANPGWVPQLSGPLVCDHRGVDDSLSQAVAVTTFPVKSAVRRGFAAAVVMGAAVMAAFGVASLGVAVWSVARATDDSLLASADVLVVFAGESARVQLALEITDGLSTGGVAPVVVFSHGLRNPLVADRCGQLRPVEVLCPVPESSNTRGEAQMFAALANERRWSNMVAVTGDYHLARARTLLTRCVDEPVEVSFVTVDWDDVALKVYLHETVGLWHAQVVDRGC